MKPGENISCRCDKRISKICKSQFFSSGSEESDREITSGKSSVESDSKLDEVAMDPLADTNSF